MVSENYHTHMYLCRHAKGDTEDYVKSAIALGFHSLGMSDHGPLDGAGFPRMSLKEFYEVYLPGISSCKKKYEGKIKLYSGIEIEYMYGRDEYYKELGRNLDYMVLGCHYYSGYEEENETSAYMCNTKERLKEYVDLAVTAMNTGLFKIFAHPDFFLCGYNSYDKAFYEACDRIGEACMKNHVYLECNANGFSKGQKENGDYCYPNKTFFSYIHKKYPLVRIVLSSDAHDPGNLVKNMDKASSMLSELGIVPSYKIMEEEHD